MKRETATPTSTPTATRVLTATPTPSSAQSPASLIGRSGGGRGSKQKVRRSCQLMGHFDWLVLGQSFIIN